MPISINGTGSITGLSAGGLPDNSIVTADIADSAVTTGKLAASTKPYAYANFGSLVEDGLTSGASRYIQITGTGSTGTTISFARTFATPLNMTFDTTNKWWTHAFTGIYFLIFEYRQDSGGDVWSQFAVTKDGTSSAVGVSARTGSNNIGPWTDHLVYYVDSTTSNYRLQGWSNPSARYAGGDPNSIQAGWTMAYGTNGSGSAMNGRIININIFRIGE